MCRRFVEEDLWIWIVVVVVVVGKLSSSDLFHGCLLGEASSIVHGAILCLAVMFSLDVLVVVFRSVAAVVVLCCSIWWVELTRWVV